MKTTRKRAQEGRPPDGELMTFAEAAEALKTTVRAVRRLALRGEFGRVYTVAGDRHRRAVARERVESFQRFIPLEHAGRAQTCGFCP